MRVTDNVKIKVYRDGVLVEESTHNLVPYSGLNYIRSIFKGTETSGNLKYMSWGTDATEPNVNDTALKAESGRKAIASFIDGSDGKVTAKMTMVGPDGAGVSIREVGLFGGAATASLNSGTLVARALWAHEKFATEVVEFDWTLTVS